MIYWIIISSHPQFSGTGHQKSLWIIFESSRRASPQGCMRLQPVMRRHHGENRTLCLVKSTCLWLQFFPGTTHGYKMHFIHVKWGLPQYSLFLLHGCDHPYRLVQNIGLCAPHANRIPPWTAPNSFLPLQPCSFGFLISHMSDIREIFWSFLPRQVSPQPRILNVPFSCPVKQERKDLRENCTFDSVMVLYWS